MRRRLLLILLLCACALLGSWCGLRLAGPTTQPTSLGDIQLRLVLSAPTTRGLDVYVPLADWGMRATVFDALLRVEIEPRRLNRDRLLDAVTGDADLHEVSSQIRRAVIITGLRAGLMGLAGGLLGGLLALLLWERLGVRGRRLLLAPAGALTLSAMIGAVLGVWALSTFSAGRLERPTFYASGSELEGILGQSEQLRSASRKYSSQVEDAIRGVAGLLGDRRAPVSDGHRLLLASDLHNNLLALDVLRRYGANQPVVLSGDFSINGSLAEAQLLSSLHTVSRQVIAVSGNHDSDALMTRLAASGVTVLTHAGRLGADGHPHGSPLLQVGDLLVAGFEDPLAFPGPEGPDGIRSQMSFPDYEDGDERMRAAVEERWHWYRQLPRRPDVLILHQAMIARELARRIWAQNPDGPPLTILAGHTHHQRLDRIGPVTVVDAGTVGAGGPFGAGKDQVGLALLNFDAGRLDATDLISMNPRNGAAEARRVITDRPDCDRRLVFCERAPQATDYSAQVRRWRRQLTRTAIARFGFPASSSQLLAGVQPDLVGPRAPQRIP